MKGIAVGIATCIALTGCGSSSATPSTRVATSASSPAAPAGSGAVGCHADLTGDLTRSLDDGAGGVGTNSYWWAYDAKQPGTVAFEIGCDLIGFRVTNGTTTAQFPRSPRHYTIVDNTKRNVGGGATDGFWALDSGPGAFDMSIDVSLTAGPLGVPYVVGAPGSFDITSFDQSTIAGTFWATLNAEPNGDPPIDTTKTIKVTGHFTAPCRPKGDPVNGDTSKDCKSVPTGGRRRSDWNKNEFVGRDEESSRPTALPTSTSGSPPRKATHAFQPERGSDLGTECSRSPHHRDVEG